MHRDENMVLKYKTIYSHHYAKLNKKLFDFVNVSIFEQRGIVGIEVYSSATPGGASEPHEDFGANRKRSQQSTVL